VHTGSSPFSDTSMNAAVSVSPDALTLLDLWKVVRRRRWVIFTITLLLIGAAIATSVFSTRRYQATGEIQVQKDSSDALGLDEMMGSAAGASDALDANITLQTQAKILESQTLGLGVVDQLHMTDTADFQSHFNPLGWVLGLLSPKGVPDPHFASLEASPKKRDHAFSVFKDNTKIAPVAGTRLIEVSYTSSDPKLASAAVNSLIQGLIDYNFQTRYTATSQASEWLGKQLSDLRGDSEQLQRRVADLQRDSGVFTFGGEDIQDPRSTAAGYGKPYAGAVEPGDSRGAVRGCEERRPGDDCQLEQLVAAQRSVACGGELAYVDPDAADAGGNGEGCDR